MALHKYYPTLAFGLLLLLLSVCGAGVGRPKALIVPVTMDPITRQYVAHIRQRTPLVSVPVVLDLGGSFLWVDCEREYASSSFRPVRCNSAKCAKARSGACINHTTCALYANNPYTRTSAIGEVAEDVLVTYSPNNTEPRLRACAADILFGCSSTGLLRGLAQGAKGVMGLGPNPAALPSQLAASFSLRRHFAICLSSSKGGVFFGSGFYPLLENYNYIPGMVYTPLLVNPRPTAGTSFTGQHLSDEYFIGVTEIWVNHTRVKEFNSTLLKINRKTGRGGTRISTLEPYTVLEGSIFRAVVSAFVKEGEGVVRPMPPVAPFGFCFDSSKLPFYKYGMLVPEIDLVLHEKWAQWRIFGQLATVEVSPGVSCLALVDGGTNVASAIAIGGFQLDNRLLEFDLATSRLGFTGYLLYHNNGCPGFYNAVSP